MPDAHSDIFTIKKGGILTGRVRYEDFDNDILMFSIQRQAEYGIIVFTNPISGEFMYIPNKDSNHQTDNFSFHIFDGHVYSNTANVYITIESEEVSSDAPTLTLQLNKDYQIGDIYTITLISSETGQVVFNESKSSKAVQIVTVPGTYRLIVLAKNYKPFEYHELITIDAESVTLELDMESARFDPFLPTLDISYIENKNGFDLRVIKKNIYELKMTIQTGTEEIPITYPAYQRSLKSTRGTHSG